MGTIVTTRMCLRSRKHWEKSPSVKLFTSWSLLEINLTSVPYESQLQYVWQKPRQKHCYTRASKHDGKKCLILLKLLGANTIYKLSWLDSSIPLHYRIGCFFADQVIGFLPRKTTKPDVEQQSKNLTSPMNICKQIEWVMRGTNEKRLPWSINGKLVTCR